MRRTIPATLIPYGVETWSPDRLSLSNLTGEGFEIAADFPFALIQRPDVPLRLNNCGLEMPAPGPFDAEASPAQRVAAHLTRLNGQWNLMGARFIARYFAFLDHQIAAHRLELDARLAKFDGLFRAEDFLFSAPIPLPRAFLHAPEPGVADKGADAFVPVDFAFWLGGSPLVLLPAQSTLTPAATRRRKERLAAAGIPIVTYGPADLTDPDFGLFTKILGTLSSFWEGETLPSAPGQQGRGLL